MSQNGRRMNIWLSEDEDKILNQIQCETGKTKSEILKESLYREHNVMDAKFANSICKIGFHLNEGDYSKIKEEIKRYADYQIRERK